MELEGKKFRIAKKQLYEEFTKIIAPKTMHSTHLYLLIS